MSATPGRASSPTRSGRRCGSTSGTGPRPTTPGRCGYLRRGDHLRRRDARRPGRPAPVDRAEIDFLAGLLERRVPLLGVCLGAQLLAAAAGGEARRAREPEIGWSGVALTPEGESTRCCPRSRPVRGLRVARLRVPATAGGDDPRRQRRLRPGLPARRSAWGIQFHAEVSPPTPSAGSTTTPPTDPDAVRIGVDHASCGRDRERIAAWNELGRGLCGRFLTAAERYSPVSGVT